MVRMATLRDSNPRSSGTLFLRAGLLVAGRGCFQFNFPNEVLGAARRVQLPGVRIAGSSIYVYSPGDAGSPVVRQFATRRLRTRVFMK